MTEDADLGVRLARFGYRCGTITTPTLEEAPVAFKPWLKQRTRWFKGWTQTILVHMRSPHALRLELGWRNYLVFVFFFVTMVVSAIVHPFFFLHTWRQIQLMASGSMPGPLDAALAVVSVFNFACGYTIYAGIAREVSHRERRKRNVGLLVVTLPVYWMAMSLAAWRAVWQFAFTPFLWEKTDHGLAKEPGSAIIVVDGGGA